MTEQPAQQLSEQVAEAIYEAAMADETHGGRWTSWRNLASYVYDHGEDQRPFYRALADAALGAVAASPDEGRERTESDVVDTLEARYRHLDVPTYAWEAAVSAAWEARAVAASPDETQRLDKVTIDRAEWDRLRRADGFAGFVAALGKPIGARARRSITLERLIEKANALDAYPPAGDG